MAKIKDILFVLSYVVLMIVCFAYIGAFANDNWVAHEDGRFGLWSECESGNASTGEPESCESSALAVGPGFLDATRTLGCFVIILVALWLLSHCRDESAVKRKTAIHFQEFTSFAAGCLEAVMTVLIARCYKDYCEDEGYSHAYLSFGWHFLAVICALTVVFSIVMFFTRPEPAAATKSIKVKVPAPSKQQGNSAKQRVQWMAQKKLPTPVEQKQKMKEEVDTQPVEVKKGWTRSIVAPTQVLIVIKRLTSGMKKEGSKDVEKSEPESLQTSPEKKDNLYKGIFTVKVDNRIEDESVPPTPVLIPSRKYSTSSSSTASDFSSDNITVIDNNTGKATVAATNEQRPAPPMRHFSQNEADLRAQAAQAAIVVTDEASVERADRLPRPPQPKRHATESDARIRLAAAGLPDEGVDGHLNIYTIHPEPGALPSAAPPSYNEVLTEEVTTRSGSK